MPMQLEVADAKRGRDFFNFIDLLIDEKRDRRHERGKRLKNLLRPIDWNMALRFRIADQTDRVRAGLGSRNGVLSPGDAADFDARSQHAVMLSPFPMVDQPAALM